MRRNERACVRAQGRMSSARHDFYETPAVRRSIALLSAETHMGTRHRQGPHGPAFCGNAAVPSSAPISVSAMTSSMPRWRRGPRAMRSSPIRLLASAVSSPRASSGRLEADQSSHASSPCSCRRIRSRRFARRPVPEMGQAVRIGLTARPRWFEGEHSPKTNFRWHIWDWLNAMRRRSPMTGKVV